MQMLDKRVEYRSFPYTHMKINEIPINFIGEVDQKIESIHIEGDPKKDKKFIVYYLSKNEIIGFATVGYKNTHLYLWEAMKLLVMPPAMQLVNNNLTHKNIVQLVLKMKDNVKCKREG